MLAFVGGQAISVIYKCFQNFTQVLNRDLVVVLDSKVAEKGN